MLPSKGRGEKGILQLGWCLDQNDSDIEQFKQALLLDMGVDEDIGATRKEFEMLSFSPCHFQPLKPSQFIIAQLNWRLYQETFRDIPTQLKLNIYLSIYLFI